MLKCSHSLIIINKYDFLVSDCFYEWPWSAARTVHWFLMFVEVVMLSRNSINNTVQLYYGTLVHAPSHAGARIMHAHSCITHAHARILHAHARSDLLMRVHHCMTRSRLLTHSRDRALLSCVPVRAHTYLINEVKIFFHSLLFCWDNISSYSTYLEDFVELLRMLNY